MQEALNEVIIKDNINPTNGEYNIIIDRCYKLPNKNIWLIWALYNIDRSQRIHIYSNLSKVLLTFKEQYIIDKKDIPIASFYPNENGWIHAYEFAKILINELS